MASQGKWAGGLRRVEPGSDQDAKILKQMHLQLLSWGPISKLGGLLLERFIYSRLVRDGLIKAAIYEVNGKPAGFVAFTTRSLMFHRDIIRRHWPTFTYLIFLSFVRNPLVFPRLAKAFRLMRSRRSEKCLFEDPLGEILAIGVLPEFGSTPFIRESGLRVSYELFDHVVAYLKSQKISKMRLVVDDFNRPALLFYHGLGGRFEPYFRAGDAMVQIWFDL